MQAQWSDPRIDDLGITLRSILTSFKGGCSLNKLQQEYAETCGSKIPFQSLGFPTLIECLQRCLGAYIRTIRRDNEFICMAVDTNEISHISALVKGQKSSKKTKKSAAPLRNRSRSYSSFSSSRGRPMLTYQSRRGSSSANRGGSSGFNGSLGRQPNNNYVFSRRPSVQDFLKDTKTCSSSSSSSSIGSSFKTSSNAESSHRMSAAFSSNQNPSSYTNNRPNSNTRMSIKEELAEAAKTCGFHEPVYRTMADGKNRYLCSVIVGTSSVGSLYPFNTPQEAQCAAAKNALERLKKYRIELSEGSNVARKEEDFEKIVENILYLLDKYPSGLMSNALPKVYFIEHKTLLPDDWIDQINENGAEISVEHVGKGSGLYIIAKAKPTSVPQKNNGPLLFTNIVTLSRPKLESANDSPEGIKPSVITRVAISPPQQPPVDRKVMFNEDNNEIHEVGMSAEDRELRKSAEIHLSTLQPLRLPDRPFRALATTVASPSDFFIRIAEDPYSEDYSNFRDRMEKFYNNNEDDRIETELDFHREFRIQGESAQINHESPFYAAYEEQSWHRVALLNVNVQNRTAAVYFVDHGDTVDVTFENLRQLEPEFVAFPAQALRCSLLYFEHLKYNDFESQVIERFQSSVLDKSLIVQRNINTDEEGALLPCFVSFNNSSILSVILHCEDLDDAETSDERQPQTFCVNELIESLIPAENLEQMTVTVSNDVEDESIREINLRTEQVSLTNDRLFASPDYNMPTTSESNIETDKEEETTAVENGSYSTNISFKFDSQSSPFDFTGDIWPMCLNFMDENGFFIGCVASAFDPSEFNVRPSIMDASLREITEHMIDFYRSEDHGEKMKLNSQPVVVGSFYAVEVVNGTQPLFFRGFCSRVDDKTLSALLYLLDSGEFFTFTYQQLRFLPRRFRQLPSTVVQCSLAKVVRPADITQYYDTNASAAFSSKVLSRFHQFRLCNSFTPKNNQKSLSSSSFENYCTLKKGADLSKPNICQTNVQEMVDIETNDNLIDWLLVHQYVLPTEAVESQAD